MGKLFIRIILLLFVSQLTFAQDSLCVYRVKGVVTKKNKTAVLKGRTIHKNDIVTLEGNSQLITIDRSGNLYVVDKPKKYTFRELITFKKKKLNPNLTSQYFKYVWSELTHEKTEETALAVVYRGNMLMQYPPNHATVFGNKVVLEWNGDAQSLFYVFIKNKTTGILTKFEVTGSLLGFSMDNPVLNGHEYEWTVTTDEFPNLKNIPFYNFAIITQDQYNELIKKQKPVSDVLLELGFNEAEINVEICQSLGLYSGVSKK